MKEKLKSKKVVLIIVIGIVLSIVLFINIRNTIIDKYNKTYIQKYVAKTYPDYKILEKSYEYLDSFWSTYYETEEDDISLEVVCQTSLQNKKTGMVVSIPFYHAPYQKYKSTQYNRKNINKMVGDYEKYWESINDLKEKYNTDIHISDVGITEANNFDIGEMIIYLKQQEDLDINQIIEDINNLEISLELDELIYVIAKEDIYKSLEPWRESNRYDVVPEGMNRIKDDSKYDLCIEGYKNKDGKRERGYSEFYIK